MDMIALLEKISVPRPNHSDRLHTTAEFLKDLLNSWGIPFSIQEFPLRPYMMLIVGVAVFLMAVCLAFSVYRKSPGLSWRLPSPYRRCWSLSMNCSFP